MPLMRYSPYVAPEPAAWLETDEDERLIAIQDFHARARDDSPSPRMHALMHLIVENQLAMPDQDSVRDALSRLRNEGLGRHEALHALGSVLAEHMVHLAQAGSGTSHGPGEYHAKLAALSAARWRDSARIDARATEPDAGSAQDRTAEPGHAGKARRIDRCPRPSSIGCRPFSAASRIRTR